MLPMVEQLQERYDKVPDEYLIDGGFAKQDDIERLDPNPDDETSSGTTIYAPVQKPKKEPRDPHQPREGGTLWVSRRSPPGERGCEPTRR